MAIGTAKFPHVANAIQHTVNKCTFDFKCQYGFKFMQNGISNYYIIKYVDESWFASDQLVDEAAKLNELQANHDIWIQSEQYRNVDHVHTPHIEPIEDGGEDEDEDEIEEDEDPEEEDIDDNDDIDEEFPQPDESAPNL